MGTIEIRVEVPDEKEDELKRIVEEIVKFYNRRNRLFELIEELKGSVETEKSWKEFEAYERGA